MTAPRSWNQIGRALVAVFAVTLVAGALGAQPASARRNVNLQAPGEPTQGTTTTSEDPGAGETPVSPPETPSGETPAPRHERRSRRGSCILTLELPRTASTGDAPQASGKLTCDEAGEAAGASVEILQRDAGSHGFATAATALTEPDGTYSVALAPLEGNVYVYARFGRARSPREAIRVSPLVTLAGPAHGAVLPLSRGRRAAQTPVTFSGTVSPSDAGAVVALQRERPLGSGSWHRVASGHVGADGSFSFNRLFRTPGPLALRAFVHRWHHRLPAVSETLEYEVAPAQNPSLTISLSPAAVAFGSPVTISGKLAGPEGATVTLLARTRGGSFESVATAVTESGGSYSFTQTPAQDTDYRVTSGSQRSMPARVQVSFAVSAVPAASSVPAGEGTTITGTVAPASPGARVYLERPASSGVGYQVLGYATVQPDSSFAISVPAAEPGSAVYRVWMPRLGSVHGAGSAPVTILTTPAGT
jgi:hypothetical protein